MLSPRPPAVHLWLTLDRVHGVLSRHLHNRLAEHGLTRPQYQVLRRLTETGRAPAAALATELGSTPGNLTGVLDRLEAAGLIARERDQQDRRTVWVSATPAAQALMVRTVPDIRDHVQAAFGPLSPAELTLMTGLLERLETQLHRAAPAVPA